MQQELRDALEAVVKCADTVDELGSIAPFPYSNEELADKQRAMYVHFTRGLVYSESKSRKDQRDANRSFANCIFLAEQVEYAYWDLATVYILKVTRGEIENTGFKEIGSDAEAMYEEAARLYKLGHDNYENGFLSKESISTFKDTIELCKKIRGSLTRTSAWKKTSVIVAIIALLISGLSLGYAIYSNDKARELQEENDMLRDAINSTSLSASNHNDILSISSSESLSLVRS